jgi:hypothetical protein
MRRVAILAIVLGCGGSTAALAAMPASARAPADPLTQAAFANNVGPVVTDPIGRLLDRESYAPGAGVVARTSSEAPLFAHDGAIDSLRIREDSLFGGPGELPLTSRAGVDAKSYEISLMRAWPGALSFDAGRLAVDVSPHAGIGVIGGDQAGGTSAEAGAMLQVSKADLAAKRLNAMGVNDGAKFGDQGRWYLFAAASGRAVGMNMLHGDAGWGRAGWSTDPTSKLVGDAQVGVGWRKGAIQTSVGYVHRKVKGDHLMYGVDPHDDSMVAFSLSIRPHK